MRYVCCWVQIVHDTLTLAELQHALARMFQQLFLTPWGYAAHCEAGTLITH